MTEVRPATLPDAAVPLPSGTKEPATAAAGTAAPVPPDSVARAAAGLIGPDRPGGVPAIRPILTWPDPRLRQPAQPVGAITDDVRILARDMLATMYAAPGRGLAATQIGVMLRLFVIDCTWKDGTPDPRVMIDPQIVALSDRMVTATEGCLSLPGIPVTVARPDAVTLRWRDPDGGARVETFSGFAALCVQHEYDHLDGRLCIDLLDPRERAALDPEPGPAVTAAPSSAGIG